MIVITPIKLRNADGTNGIYKLKLSAQLFDERIHIQSSNYHNIVNQKVLKGSPAIKNECWKKLPSLEEKATGIKNSTYMNQDSSA